MFPPLEGVRGRIFLTRCHKYRYCNLIKKSQSMKILKTKKGGELTESEKDYLGGEFSVLEKLKNKGSGSNRFIYHKGLDEFDSLKRGVEGEIVFVNLELFKNGLVLRANCNQRTRSIGYKLNELTSISMIGFRIQVRYHIIFWFYLNRIVHDGQLEIQEASSAGNMKFSVIPSEYKALSRFLRSTHLVNVFSESISLEEAKYATSEIPLFRSISDLF